MSINESQVIQYNDSNSNFVAFRYKQLSLYYQDNTVCRDSEKKYMRLSLKCLVSSYAHTRFRLAKQNESNKVGYFI